MARKLILLMVLISTSLAFSMTLKGSGKIIELEKKKAGYYLSKNCRNCLALTTIKSLNQAKITSLLKTQKDHRLAPGTRLCSALGAMVWVLEDEKKVERSICQFKDNSVVLTDDLGNLIQTRIIGIRPKK